MPRGFVDDITGLENIGAEGGAIDERLRDEFGRIQDTADRVGEAGAVAGADLQAQRNADNDRGQFDRATRTLDASARQKRGAGRRLGLARALNRARATGSVRRGFADRAKAAMSAGGSFADMLFGQRLSGQTALASAQATEEAGNMRRDANKKSSMFGTIGTVAGLALSFFSSEELKHDLGREPQLLNRLKKVRVNRWQYKGDDETHVGPFSEEFNREFGIDTDRPDMINVIDALGVTLGAVKELNEKVEARG